VAQDFNGFLDIERLVFSGLGSFGFIRDLDSFGLSDIASFLTMQILKGFWSLHNLFDKWIVFLDFWKFQARTGG